MTVKDAHVDLVSRAVPGGPAPLSPGVEDRTRFLSTFDTVRARARVLARAHVLAGLPDDVLRAMDEALARRLPGAPSYRDEARRARIQLMEARSK